MRLFDASAIINLAKRGKFKAFLNGATLDLAIYEALNAIWKETNLLKRIDEKTALEYSLSFSFKFLGIFADTVAYSMFSINK